MKHSIQILLRATRLVAMVLLAIAMSRVCLAGTNPPSSEGQESGALLRRTADQTQMFLDQFSDVKCIEQVRQEKLGKQDKVELKEESTYDYLVILTNAGGELNLSESRIPVHEPKRDRRNTPMLLSNGFATLFLIFHPYYSSAFKFTLAGEEAIGGRNLEKVHFEHIVGTKSPAALALRGREYPLELSGIAWIDAETGSIARIQAGIADSLVDVGLKSLNSEIDFAPVLFADSKTAYWFPTQAVVEVETPRQHWRNLHQFTAYKKFSVTTEEQVTTK